MRILGIDFGTRRIGLALSDPMGIIAGSLEVINRTDIKADMKRIREVVEQNEVSSIVVGMPISMNGSLGIKVDEVNSFIEMIKKSVDIPIIEWDERLTTVIGEQVLIDADMSRQKRRKVIDKVAASVMLQSYLDSKRT